MEGERGFHSEKGDKYDPIKSSPETPAKKTKKNMVQVSRQQQKPSSSPLKKAMTFSNSPKLETLQEKTITSEQIRIKGQQKLHYLKQYRQRDLPQNQIFQNYPFSKMVAFQFNDQQLRDQNGNFTAQLIEDEKGIHLVSQFRSENKSRYITTQQEEELNSFNGLSVSLFSNGNIFEGNYHNGNFCGLGYELQANGNTYIGQFKEGVKQGFGTYYWFSNAQTYSGEWHGGLPHGLGAYFAKDHYEGSFANGLKYGFGQQHFFNGDRYIGQYINSVAEGYGEYYWSDGSVYKGDFKQGLRHGYGIWSDQNEVFKGNYRLDKKQGFGMYTWKNKQVYKGEFRDDYRQGYGQIYSFAKGEQKLAYKGCWIKGKKDQQGEVDESKMNQLHLFLDRTIKLDENIEHHSKRQKRQKVGHKNCIPKDTSPHHNHKHF